VFFFRIFIGVLCVHIGEVSERHTERERGSEREESERDREERRTERELSWIKAGLKVTVSETVTFKSYSFPKIVTDYANWYFSFGLQNRSFFADLQLKHKTVTFCAKTVTFFDNFVHTNSVECHLFWNRFPTLLTITQHILKNLQNPWVPYLANMNSKKTATFDFQNCNITFMSQKTCRFRNCNFQFTKVKDTLLQQQLLSARHYVMTQEVNMPQVRVWP